MKFGLRLNIQGEMGATSSAYEYTLEMARMAEDLGFDSVWIPDHVENAHLDRSRPILEFWTTLTALGAQTERVRLGGHSVNNNFRHPGLTAKILCTLDQITGGRVIYAPGSGWFADEAKAYGFPQWSDDGLTRIARLDETLRIVRGLMTEDVFSFEGMHFTLRDAYCNPKPVQRPYPPIWVAGDSVPTQGLMAEHGDVWLMYSKQPDIVAGLIAGMRAERSTPFEVALSAVGLAGQGEDATLEWAKMYAAERRHRFPVPPTVQDVMEANLTGDAGAVCARIDQWASVGVGHVIIQPMPPIEGTRFFGEKILPRYL
ncbi:MAG: LLM class flavin-dependent oxidoreductase [Rhodospirillales bacterium]|nr:MAG: LLM class flavin-dependent oxidoreductase [Rhodospirillales bacterium]